MRNYSLYAVIAVCSAVQLFSAESENRKAINPYGVCSHLSRWEFDKASESVKLMREAGMGSFRTDLDWIRIEPERRKFNFKFWDNLIDIASAEGIEVLSIIPGGTPKFARPFPHHADEMAVSSAEIVRHFKGRIKYWEIVNEPNHISFWDGLEPNASEYAALLKKVYPAVKKANPDAVVLYGGLAGVPLDYLEKTFKEGAAKSFDVMNIHPYNWRGVQENVLIKNVQNVRDLMKKYGVGDKPIWITELGYSSAEMNPCTKKYLKRALEKMGIDSAKSTIGYLSDEKYNFFSDAFTGSVERAFPDAKKYRRITFKKLATLSPENCPVLFMGENESFPYEYIDALYEYIKKGGVAVTIGGLPFYFDIKLDKNGNPVLKPVGRDTMKYFRLSSKTWSDPDMAFVKPMLSNARGHRGDVVEKVSAEGFEDIKPIGHYHGRLYLSDDALGVGDKMTPILWGKFGDKKLLMAAMLKYGGDVKGGFIAFFARGGENATEKLQAEMLPREYILARSAGVERIYKYCFRDNEWDYTRESHFGIVRKSLEPKLAYQTYKTLTSMLGNSIPQYSQIGGVHIAQWKKSDGTPVCAVWTSMYKKSVSLEFVGVIKSIKDYIGNDVSYSAKNGKLKMLISGKISYIVGVSEVKLLK